MTFFQIAIVSVTVYGFCKISGLSLFNFQVGTSHNNLYGFVWKYNVSCWIFDNLFSNRLDKTFQISNERVMGKKKLLYEYQAIRLTKKHKIKEEVPIIFNIHDCIYIVITCTSFVVNTIVFTGNKYQCQRTKACPRGSWKSVLNGRATQGMCLWVFLTDFASGISMVKLCLARYAHNHWSMVIIK